MDRSISGHKRIGSRKCRELGNPKTATSATVSSVVPTVLFQGDKILMRATIRLGCSKFGVGASMASAG
jgi:hypothetical protein